MSEAERVAQHVLSASTAGEEFFRGMPTKNSIGVIWDEIPTCWMKGQS